MKIVIVVLVLILALFLVGVGLGANQERGDGDVAEGGLAEFLRDKLIGPGRLVVPSEVLGTCRQGDAISLGPGGTCLLSIGKSSDIARKLRLVQATGQVSVQFTPPKGIRSTSSIPDEDDLDAEFNIAREGARLTVTCVSLEPCVLAIDASE